MSIIEKAVDKMMGKLDTPAPSGPDQAEKKVEPKGVSAQPDAEVRKTVAERAVAEEAPAVKRPSQPAPAIDEAPQVKSPDLEFSPAGMPVGDKADGMDGEILRIRELALEGVLSPDSERSRSAEEYRMIKRPLLTLSLIHISEPTRLKTRSRMPSSA